MNSLITFILVSIVIVLLLFCVTLIVVFGKRMSAVRESALRDSITGGLNFEGLQNRARRRSMAEYTVVAMKLKNWAQIVETFGSENAERVLKYIHATLQSNLSAAEPFARISGADFCMLMKNRETDFVRTRLERIAEGINRFNGNAKIPYMLNVCFGAYQPVSGEESLFRLCEISQRYADIPKESGVYFGSNAEENSAERRWDFASQIDTALANGDFVIYLQPKISLHDGRVSGAEAFVRWRHSLKGLITSAAFVSELEEFHVIDRLDKFVFESVCRKQAEWKKEGLPLCVISVNLSLDTIKRKNFAREFARYCTACGVDTKLIEFELNEKLLNESREFIRDVIDSIHDCGFRCSFDNFGNTAVPLRMMCSMGVDSIKLERSFFSLENNNRKNRFLIEAILKYAAQIGISTVAEGIENSSQVQYLQQTGCDMIQGFFFFNPMGLDEYKNTVYVNGELVSVQLNRDEPAAGSSFGTEDGGIAMFSYSTAEDAVFFSECFSPALGGARVHQNASSLFLKSSLIHENDRRDFFHMIERCKKDGVNVENILRFYAAEGRYEWLTVCLHRAAVLKNGEAIIAGALVNKSLWKKEVKRWQDKATRDALTGLYNRDYFERTVSEGLEKGDYERGAMVFIDVDDFKKINDTLGHLNGDGVLQLVAKRLLGVFRQSDIVARYAGDEFVVFVNGISKEDMVKRLAHLVETFQTPYKNGSVEYTVYISIGVSMFPDDGGDYRTLIKKADDATYTVKGSNKNNFAFYKPGMETVES